MNRGIDTTRCPEWCESAGVVVGRHPHVSANIIEGSAGQPLVARLVDMNGDGEVSVVVNERVLSIEDAQSFVSALGRLLDRTRLAEPGLGFVASLVDRAQVSIAELATVAQVDVERLRDQESGSRVLTVREFDRVALAAAHLASGAATRSSELQSASA